MGYPLWLSLEAHLGHSTAPPNVIEILLEQELEVPRVPKPKVIQSLPSVKGKTQIVVNKYIRLRDFNSPCISCYRIKEGKEAGHYISQGSSGALRYNEDNLNGQCTSCNRFMHGNLVNYRIGLVIKIGEKRVKYLEDHRHDIKKWSREELQQVTEEFKKKLENL